MKLYLRLLLVCFYSCTLKNENNPDSSLIIGLLGVNTSYQECAKNSIINQMDFSDPAGDVKLNPFIPVITNQEYRDLIGGKLELTDNYIQISLKLVSVPTTIFTNQTTKSYFPEFEWISIFSNGIENYTIGIIYYVDDSTPKKNFTDFSVSVLKNANLIGACSPLTLNGNNLQFYCDLNSFPELKSIDTSYKFNFEVRQRTNNGIYKDCY